MTRRSLFAALGLAQLAEAQQYAPLAIQLPFQFADAEAPQQAAPGVYALSRAPNPPASLQLTRNGLTLQQGQDYTLSGNLARFAAEAAPQPDDKMQAWYRF